MIKANASKHNSQRLLATNAESFPDKVFTCDAQWLNFSQKKSDKKHFLCISGGGEKGFGTRKGWKKVTEKYFIGNQFRL